MAAGFQNFGMFLAMVLFGACMITTFIVVSKGISATSPDLAAEMNGAVRTITITNSLMIFGLAIMSFLYLRANTDAFFPYTVIMLHLVLFLSLMGVSIAAITKLNP